MTRHPRGAQEAQGEATWRRAAAWKCHVTTWVHVGTRVQRHVEGGFAYGGPTGIVGPGKKLGAVTQMRYRAPIVKHGELHYFLRVGHSPTGSLPLQVMWTHCGRWIRSKRRRSRGPESTRSLNRDTC